MYVTEIWVFIIYEKKTNNPEYGSPWPRASPPLEYVIRLNYRWFCKHELFNTPVIIRDSSRIRLLDVFLVLSMFLRFSRSDFACWLPKTRETIYVVFSLSHQRRGCKLTAHRTILLSENWNKTSLSFLIYEIIIFFSYFIQVNFAQRVSIPMNTSRSTSLSQRFSKPLRY